MPKAQETISDEMKDFLNYLCGKLSENPFIRQIDHAVELARLNKEWRTEYMLSRIDIAVMKGEYERTIAEKDSELAKKDSILAEKDSTIAQKDSALAEKDALLKQYIEKFGELKD